MSDNTTTSKIRSLTVIALMAAVICILGPLSIPLPFSPVPISFTNLAIYITVILIGMKRGTISFVIYLLLGLAGLPVFSAFTAGPSKLLGPTGGYLIGFIFMCLITGLFADRAMKFDNRVVKIGLLVLGMILATAVTYVFGTAWLAFQAGMTFKAALFAGVIPFIPGDLAKIVISVLAGPVIRERLEKVGLV